MVWETNQVVEDEDKEKGQVCVGHVGLGKKLHLCSKCNAIIQRDWGHGKRAEDEPGSLANGSRFRLSLGLICVPFLSYSMGW